MSFSLHGTTTTTTPTAAFLRRRSSLFASSSSPRRLFSRLAAISENPKKKKKADFSSSSSSSFPLEEEEAEEEECDDDEEKDDDVMITTTITEKLMKRRTYSRRRKETNIINGNKTTIAPPTPTPTNKVVQKYKKKDVLFQAQVEKDIEEAIFVYNEEQKEEEEKECWSAKSENERVEEFSRLLRVSEGTMNAPVQAFRFARRYFLEREDGEGEFSRRESYSQSRFFKKMNVAQHHGPFFDQCAKANAFELMMEYYGLFDPRDDKMDGGRLANAFISRMSREMRDGENNDEGFDLNASTTKSAKKNRNQSNNIKNNNAFYFEFVRQAFETSLTKNEYTVSAFLKACGKANRLNDAKKAFENMKKNGTPKAIVYRSYIDCCASCADCEEALETFQQFKVDVLGKDKRIRDDTDAVRAFNGVIAAAKNARNVNVAKSIFQELTEDFAYLAPTEITYGAAITAAANASPIPDLEFALDLFNRSREDPSVQGDMNKYIVSATLSCLQRSLAVGAFTESNAKAVALAKNITRPLLQRYEEESKRLRETNKLNNGKDDYFNVSSQVFSALVSVYARANDVESAMDIIEQMQKLGFAVNRHILTSALTACRPRADDANGQAMATKGVELFEQSNKSVRETSSVASAAMFLYFHLGDVKKATDLYDTVKLRTNENSTLDNQILFNTMLLHCAKKTKSHTSSNNAENAISIFRDMRRANVPATERTYSLMLTALGTHGNRFTDVEKVYKLANRDPNVLVNDFMRTAWMDANVKAHRVEEALDVYDSIIESYSNIEEIGEDTSNTASPSIVTFGSALFGCLTMSVERENVDVAAEKAYKIFADMAKFNVVPNDWCSNLFVKVISRAGRVEDTISELKSIIKCGGSIQDDTLEGVVRALCRAGYPERALRVYKWLRSRQSDNENKSMKATIMAPKKVAYYHLTRGTFQDLVQSCADNGFLADAWNLVERRKKYHSGGKMTVAEELGPLAMGSLFKAVARNAEVVEQEVDFMSKTKTMAKLAIESETSLFGADVLCALVEAFARSGDLASAMEFWEYYEKQNCEADDLPRKMKKINPYQKDTPRSKMYGALIDECCRLNEVSSALSVFDKAKDAEVGLNTVTLAFLESCCRRSRVDEWRVFDVCAQMRIQSEQRKSMKNPQAQRPLFSHHVTGDLEYESSNGEESTVDATITAAMTPVVPPKQYSDAIESALENRSAAPKSGNKKKNGSRERNKYKSAEEMHFFDDEMY